MAADRILAISDLLVRAEEAHASFEAIELDGVYDTEWPTWYAAWAVENGVGALVGRDIGADELAQFLRSTNADFERDVPRRTEPWAAYTARRMAAEL